MSPGWFPVTQWGARAGLGSVYVDTHGCRAHTCVKLFQQNDGHRTVVISPDLTENFLEGKQGSPLWES